MTSIRCAACSDSSPRSRSSRARAAAVAPRPPDELYDLRADPSESHDLAPQQPDRVAALRTELARRLGAIGPAPERHASEIDAASKEQLRALGYAE